VIPPRDDGRELGIEATVTTLELSPAQHAEARRIADLAYAEGYDDFLHMARVLIVPARRPARAGLHSPRGGPHG
jgi:hypothetical protein